MRNPSYYYDNFILMVDNPPLPEGWRADFYVQNKRVRGIGVEGFGTTTLTLKVTVPEDAFPNDYQFAAYAEGKYSRATCLLTVTVESPPIEEYEIDVYCPIDWQVTYPGNNLTFNLRLTNGSPYRDNYLLSIDNPELPINWTAVFMVDGSKVRSISLASGDYVDLVLIVNVPKETGYGDFQFRVNIEGNYGSTSQGLTVTVERVPRKISLESPIRVQTILTGEDTFYPIKVVNEESSIEKVFLSIKKTSSIMVWDITFSENQLTLGPGESVWIMLNVQPPSIVDQGNYSIEIEALTEDEEIMDSLQVYTNIVASYMLEIVDIAPINPQVYQGDKINVVVTVRNSGQSPVTGLRLTVESTGLSNILVTPLDYTYLEAKGDVDFNLRISADSSLAVGDYILRIKAQSNEYSTDVREFTVSVASQIPWSTIMVAVAIVATAVVVLIIQSLIRRAGIQVKIRK
ncbi:hypothetical protein KEJ18_06340 [Candidatus Bathyarchaeota archaeon]|nr:hypothetical protein [Candidatus Bathyarchaeota archaeon]